jgi:hypothetical protein
MSRPLASHCRARSPPAISLPFRRTHHLPAPPPTALLHSTPETEPRQLGFRFLVQTPPPDLMFAHARPPRCLRAILPHPSPPSTTAHCRFAWHARNRATNTRFRGFGPNPAPLASRCRTRSLPAISLPFYRTHNLTAPPPTALLHSTPEAEPRRLGFGFLAQIPPPASHLANA